MKKILIYVLCLFLLVYICGCKNINNSEENNEILIIDASDNVCRNIKLDDNPLKNESKVDDSAKKRIVLKESIFGSINATYIKSIKSNYQYFYCDVYRSSSPNVTIFVDPKGRIVKYQCADYEIKEDGIVLSQDELIAKANKIVSSYVDINDYNIEFNPCKQLKECYEISFTKFIGEIRTADYACVTYTKDGQLVSFNSSYLGMIDKSYILNIDIDEIKSLLNDKVEDILVDIKGEWNKFEYNEYNFVLVKTGKNNYALICDLNLSFKKEIDKDSFIGTGEILRFLINF